MTVIDSHYCHNDKYTITKWIKAIAIHNHLNKITVKVCAAGKQKYKCMCVPYRLARICMR